MNGEVAEVGEAEERGRVVLSSAWRVTLGVAAVCVVAILLLYRQSFWSMVTIWARSETFAHGFFILPISLYVVWLEREEIAAMVPSPEARPLVVVWMSGAVWLAAHLAAVNVVQHYAVVAVLVATNWTVLGTPVARRLWFPLGFMFLAVPVGAGLVPFLIDHTATFVVGALRLSGITVLRQGNLLTLTNSQWSVVEACSGLRYLIACVTIGLPFAYLTYRSWKRRALFVGASIAVPIVANWLRAYMIVMIGYLSDMKLAVGIDHILYGWVFYAAVMFLLLWGGSRFREDPAEVPAPAPPSVPFSRARSAGVGVAAVLFAAVWPLWSVYASTERGRAVEGLSLPETVSGWAVVPSSVAFAPVYANPDVEVARAYRRAEGEVLLHVAAYGRQRERAELVGAGTVIVAPDDPGWRELSGGTFATSAGKVDERILGSASSFLDSRLLIWRWYWVGGELTSSPVWAKVLQARERLLGRPAPGAGIVLVTPIRGDESEARTTLSGFTDAVLPRILASLEEAAP